MKKLYVVPVALFIPGDNFTQPEVHFAKAESPQDAIDQVEQKIRESEISQCGESFSSFWKWDDPDKFNEGGFVFGEPEIIPE